MESCGIGMEGMHNSVKIKSTLAKHAISMTTYRWGVANELSTLSCILATHLNSIELKYLIPVRAVLDIDDATAVHLMWFHIWWYPRPQKAAWETRSFQCNATTFKMQLKQLVSMDSVSGIDDASAIRHRVIHVIAIHAEEAPPVRVRLE